MSWKFLNRSEIDQLRWDQVVTQHSHSRMYCLSDYLDAASDNWSALIYGDYEYIMPLPYKTYLLGLIKKHYIPLFIQQLGVIGINPIPKEILTSSIRLAQSKFHQFIHPLNHENYRTLFSFNERIERTNYELDLKRTYLELSSNYKSNLTRNLKTCQNRDFDFSDKGTWEDIEFMVKKHSNTEDPSPAKLNILRAIHAINFTDFHSVIYKVEENNNLHAICLAPRFNDRITLLVPRSTPEGRSSNAMAFLIDQIIQENAEKDIILDFEGSMIPGVANFYEQFGSTNCPYFVIT